MNLLAYKNIAPFLPTLYIYVLSLAGSAAAIKRSKATWQIVYQGS